MQFSYRIPPLITKDNIDFILHQFTDKISRYCCHGCLYDERMNLGDVNCLDLVSPNNQITVFIGQFTFASNYNCSEFQGPSSLLINPVMD